MTIKNCIKKVASVLLATVTLAIACGNISPTAEKISDSAKAQLVVIPNTLRLKQDDDLPDYGYGKELSVKLAKSETDGGQFIIYANKAVSSFSVGVTDLVNADGEEIPRENIDVYAEHYIYVANSEQIDLDAFSAGYYPDALIPMANYVHSGENKIKQGRNQGVWIDVSADADTTAGEYTGKVIVNVDGEVHTLDFNVEVYDFDITKETHFKSAYNLWSNNTFYCDQQATVHGYSDQELFTKYYNYMVDYRAMPMDIPSMNLHDYEAYALDLYEYASRIDVASYTIPTEATTVTIDGNLTSIINFDRIEDLFRELLDLSLEKKFDLFEKMYIYVPYHDEPHSTVQYEALRMSSDGVENVKKKLAEEYEETGAFSGEFGKTLCEHMLGVPQLITVMSQSIMNDLQGYVDAWCPGTPMYNSAENRVAIAERQQAGDEVWWYTAGNKNPNPNYHIHEHMLATRMLGLMSYELNVDGNLFWASNLFSIINVSDGIYNTIPRDVWEDSNAYPSSGPGNAYLVYPGEKYNVDGPIGTLRLTSIRDGQEDYEYLYQLNKLLEETNLDYGLRLTAEEYVDDLMNRLFTNIRTVIDHEEMIRVREEIANLICALQDKDFSLIVKCNGKNAEAQTQSLSIYAKAGVSVSVNGKGLTGVACGSGFVFNTTVALSEKSNQAIVTATKGDKELTLVRNLGGKIQTLTNFEAEEDVSNLSIRGDNAGSIETDPDKVLTGEKSLKLSWKAPAAGGDAADRKVWLRSRDGFDFSNAKNLASIEFDIYNDSDETLILDFNTNVISAIVSTEVPAREKTHIYVPFSRYESGDLEDMSYFEINLKNSKATVYVDDIYMTYRQYDRIEHVMKRSDLSDVEETQIHQPSKDEQGNLLMCGFEEEVDIRRAWFDNFFNSYIALVDYQDAVTEGNRALEVVYNGAWQFPQNAKPCIRFDNANTAFTGFYGEKFEVTDYSAFAFDVVNYGEEITFTVAFVNNKKQSISQTFTVGEGEKTTIVAKIDKEKFAQITAKGFGELYHIKIAWPNQTNATQKSKHFCIDNVRLMK